MFETWLLFSRVSQRGYFLRLFFFLTQRKPYGVRVPLCLKIFLNNNRQEGINCARITGLTILFINQSQSCTSTKTQTHKLTVVRAST
jgi:hypothetical protein